MMNLIKHHRLHIPNALALLAVVLLLITGVAGLDTNQETYFSGQDNAPALKVDVKAAEGINDAAGQKRRGLNLGLMLFPRR